MMRYFLPVMSMVSLTGREELPEPWSQLTDQDDAPVWATAQLGGAAFVVSHNTRHFPPLASGKHVYQGIEYLTAVEFIEEILGREVGEVYVVPYRFEASFEVIAPARGDRARGPTFSSCPSPTTSTTS